MSQRVKYEVLYCDIEKVSTNIIRRRLTFAGHCLRRDDEVISDLVIWEPTHIFIKRERLPDINVRTIERDTGISLNKMRVAMINYYVWRTCTALETTIPK